MNQVIKKNPLVKLGDFYYKINWSLYFIYGEEFVPCPSLSALPPIAKIARPTNPSMPKIGAERLVMTDGAPEDIEEIIIDLAVIAECSLRMIQN